MTTFLAGLFNDGVVMRRTLLALTVLIALAACSVSPAAPNMRVPADSSADGRPSIPSDTAVRNPPPPIVLRN